ncbi:MAG: FtsX-like permease family protein [Candidatus Omnitrophica bacterium]|nr:FtsX-like permease family protein [Candidatus Omnitrophota bacterium]MCM8802874.1 FtsX-like permease family protein [Candidatus Omnitrophota bacterium]
MEKKIEKQLSLPLKNALQMSLRNFKIRFGRAIIVTMSILLGIAFFMSIMASNVFTMALIEKGPENIRTVLVENLPEIKVKQRWLVTLSLLVCTVGIINSMLMAVTERSREIGTMKCLGALDRFVMELFLLEAMIHGIGGSIIGSFLGILIMTLVYIAQYKKIILSIFPTLTLLKFVGISIILGTGLAIIGALYPAIVSARMEPAEAIRREV